MVNSAGKCFEGKESLKILFCGIAVPEEVECRVKDISAAGNRFQNNVIKNLKALGHEVIVVSYVSIPIPAAFLEKLQDTPNRKYIVRESQGWKQTCAAVKRCRRTVEKLIETADCVICYNIFYSYYFLPWIARKYSKKSLLILADYSGPESFKNVGRKIYACLQARMLQSFDTVIGLSANTEKRLKKGQKFILMEGGIDQEFYDSFTFQEKTNEKPVVFMYSGLLSRVTGVDLLLKAMKENEDPDIRLVITGKGNLEQQVRDAERKDSRIQYKGHLSYEEYIGELQKADVLVNPRNMALPENQNNFPSKILEYLATGKRIVSTKFVGWEKFHDHIKFLEMESLEKIFFENRNVKEEYLAERMLSKRYLWSVQLKKLLGEQCENCNS